MQSAVPIGRSEQMPAVVDLDLRQADSSDFERLMSFYQSNASAGLPAPSVATLGAAVSDGRVLLVEANRGHPILAAAAIFEFSPPGWRTYVGELSGTCVTRQLNGYGPMSLQRVLLAARVLGHVALNNEVAPDSSSTLVTIVKTDNSSSIRNVVAAGFQVMQDKPSWMEYDEHAWHGSPVGTGWLYFVANDATARQAYTDLEGVGLFAGVIRLSRTERTTGRLEIVQIRSLLADMAAAGQDLLAIQAGRPTGLAPPPAQLAP